MNEKRVSFFLGGMIFLFLGITLRAKGPDTLWTRTYGGADNDYGWSVQQTSNGGYIVAGETSSYGLGLGDAYLIRTNPFGDTVWTKTFGGTNHDNAYCVDQTSDGGYIIVGGTRSYGPGWPFIFLIKVDENGDTSWTNVYGGVDDDYGCSVQQTTDGGYVILGSTKSFGAGNYDFYLIKTEPDGDTVFTRTYGGVEEDIGFDVQQTSDGGFIIVGYSFSFGVGNNDVYLVKTTSNGDTIWTKTYGDQYFDMGKSVRQTSDGGYIIAGALYSTRYSHDVYLIKTNAQGDTFWTREYGGAGLDLGESVRQTNDGGYIIAGYTESYGAGDYDIYLIKTDSIGDTIWTGIYGGENDDEAHSIQQTSDNEYIIAGNTRSFGAGNCDIYLLKIKQYVNIDENEIPKGLFPYFLQASPNPFSERIEIRFLALSNEGGIINPALAIYDIRGREIRNFSSLSCSFPTHTPIQWDGTDDFGRNVPAGIYFLILRAGECTASKKLIKFR